MSLLIFKSSMNIKSLTVVSCLVTGGPLLQSKSNNISRKKSSNILTKIEKRYTHAYCFQRML